jgi:hypothetical protein
MRVAAFGGIPDTRRRPNDCLLSARSGRSYEIHVPNLCQLISFQTRHWIYSTGPHNSLGASVMRYSELVITLIEQDNEISSNQTTNKTRASADTAQNQGSSEGTGRFAARCPTLENQEQLSRITIGWDQEKPGRLVSSQTRFVSGKLF